MQGKGDKTNVLQAGNAANLYLTITWYLLGSLEPMLPWLLPFLILEG